MRAARTLALFALLPLFAACQMFENEPAKPSLAGLTRMERMVITAGMQDVTVIAGMTELIELRLDQIPPLPAEALPAGGRNGGF